MMDEAVTVDFQATALRKMGNGHLTAILLGHMRTDEMPNRVEVPLEQNLPFLIEALTGLAHSRMAFLRPSTIHHPPSCFCLRDLQLRPDPIF